MRTLNGLAEADHRPGARRGLRRRRRPGRLLRHRDRRATGRAFCLSEVKLGLIPAVISPYVVAAIGARAARRYFLTAERFDAAEAQRLGLVHEVVADGGARLPTVERLVGGAAEERARAPWPRPRS